MPPIDYTLPLDELPDPLPIEPLTKPFDVTITPPGSKSITCRAYVLAALAQGESKIVRPLRADDTDHLLKALCQLGAEARWEDEDVYIKGVAGRFPRGGNLYMGEGGTPSRFMIACACLANEPVTIDASPRMRERPIAEGVDMLRQLGAKIDYMEAEGRLPVRVVPSEEFRGGELTIGKTASSQFISAIMLVASYLENGVGVQCSHVTSEPYLALTANVLKDFGAETGQNLLASAKITRPKWIHVKSGCLSHVGQYCIPADASSAVYWILASSLVEDARCMVVGLNLRLLQPDVGAVEAIGQIGCIKPYTDYHGDVTIAHRLKGAVCEGFHLDCESMPDGSVALAVASSKCRTNSRLTGLQTLRVKETDRIAALANELRKVGCVVETGEDWIEITPSPSNRRDACSTNSAATGGTGLSPVVIETYNDHRMAMAFAVLGLNPPNGVPLAIRNPKCVAKSYPGFWNDFAKLYQ